MNKYFFVVILASLILSRSRAEDSVAPDLEEVNVFESLKKTGDAPANSADVKMSNLEEQDDLQSLKEDIGDVVFDKEKDKETKKESNELVKGPLNVENPKVNNFESSTEEKAEIVADQTANFDIGNEEKKLLDLSKFVDKKITGKEWDDIAIKAKLEKYEVQRGDYLWKISKKLFGSGFYYSKVWALNPQISNPHEIEPGTVLAFDTGDSETLPNVQVGEFSDEEVIPSKTGGSSYAGNGGENQSSWIKERKKLIDQGVYFQFASEETYDDLERLEKMHKNLEYEKYDPPLSNVTIKEPSDQYDNTGFDKNSKIIFNYKEGFFLNSFVTTNVVQDLGEIKATPKESVFIHKLDTIYVSFDKSAKVKPGDLFSVYTAGGEIKNPISDRSGFVYTTTAQIKVIRSIDNVWECMVVEQSGIVQRKDRITVYTPKIGKIAKTFSKRSIEAAIIGSYRESLTGIAFGDVVYLDRGRADGVELGNIFEVYSFVDRGTQRKITPSPTYKVGELTVINITDNFATALVTGSSNEISMGSIAITKTQEEAARALRLKNKDKLKDVKKLEGKALEELDVELNLDDVSQDILNKADKIQLTEDELEELERLERDKSVIKDSERDVKELDRLEGEIQDSEKSLNESKVDEDKFLEQSSLEDLEKKAKDPDPNAFESINEIEKDIGKKYMDEDINNKENPYGLTEFDLEEVDELLNTGSKK
ncbi:MAG: LysM peptidoglycan-binding domain-containing protein [Bacteriovorax sp.]|nr:LysM peptidoglycan-binding domain-containing protein [Bacteriovorax sp.]